MKQLPHGSSITFKDTDSFQNLLRMAAEENIDCAMVWDFILQKYPEQTSKVEKLFDKNDLPAPVLIIAAEKNSGVNEKIIRFATNDSNAFFSGFQAPDIKLINQFLVDMKSAREHFHILES